MKDKAIFITRSDISLCSVNSNVYLKSLEVATKYDATLYVSKSCGVPDEIAEKYVSIVRFGHAWDVLTKRDAGKQCAVRVFTGFDFPSMYVAWQLKKRYGYKWIVFLWDPPCLSYRDGFPPLRWTIDMAFRFFARRCDRLVLNIHPGLLDEIGYKPPEGQLELRMQDAWDGKDFSHSEHIDCTDGFEYDFGVLANWTKSKGGELLLDSMKRMPSKKCLWIGDPPKWHVDSHIEFAGRLPQPEAFALLRKCRVLVVPYLPTRSLKWNYPLKLFEYLEIGRPIVASDNPGNATIAAQHPDCITLFKSGDVDDFTTKMCSV